MQGNEEIDALTTLGVSPSRVPGAAAVVALTLLMPLLYVYGCAFAILGGLVRRQRRPRTVGRRTSCETQEADRRRELRDRRTQGARVRRACCAARLPLWPSGRPQRGGRWLCHDQRGRESPSSPSSRSTPFSPCARTRLTSDVMDARQRPPVHHHRRRHRRLWGAPGAERRQRPHRERARSSRSSATAVRARAR